MSAISGSGYLSNYYKSNEFSNSDYYSAQSSVMAGNTLSGNSDLKIPSDKSLGINISKDLNDPLTRINKQLGVEECLTCKTRKYQDGSDDPGVSFKSPGHISPEASAAVVMGHEQEHVQNERSNAKAEGRKVISQNVSLETSVCSECGKVYVSGGKTTTVTASDNKEKSDFFKGNYKAAMMSNFGLFVDSKV